REWARTLPRGPAVIDLGCGAGFPITEVLVMEGLNVYAIDAPPSFIDAFRRNLPGIPVACEAVEDSTADWKPFMIVHTISGVRFSPLPNPSVATGRTRQSLRLVLKEHHKYRTTI